MTIPAVAVAATASKFLGRKITIIVGFSMIFLLSVVPLCYSKAFIVAYSGINFFVMFIICTGRLLEMYPTKLRDISLGVVYAISKVGKR